jgi:hypothetical protein
MPRRFVYGEDTPLGSAANGCVYGISVRLHFHADLHGLPRSPDNIVPLFVEVIGGRIPPSLRMEANHSLFLLMRTGTTSLSRYGDAQFLFIPPLLNRMQS